MAPLNWGAVMDVDPTDLQDADELRKDLLEFEVGGEKDAKKLKHLFSVTQAVLIYTTVQYEVAEEKMAEIAEQQGKVGARRDQNLDDLRNEIQALERENKNLKMGGGGGGGGGGRDTHFLRQELMEMERQMGLQAKDLSDKERQLLEYRRTVDQYDERFRDMETELKELKMEKEALLEENRDYDHRLALQRETMLSRRDDDAESMDKVRQLNSQLNELLSENEYIQNLMKNKDRDLEEMKEELKQGRIEINKTTDQNDLLKGDISKCEKENTRLNREVEMLRALLQDVSDQAKNKYHNDDIMLDDKIQEWQMILTERDEQVRELEEEKLALKEQLLAANMDSEKASVAMLNKALEERDKQVLDLRSKLDAATADMDTNTALMQDVQSTLAKGGKSIGERQAQKIGTLQTTLRLTESQLKDADQLVKDAEKDARSKDKQLSEALERMRQYEAGEYGLPEAVAEIKENKLLVAIRDRKIEELTQYINKEEMRMNDLADEVEELRERLGLDPKEPVDLTEFNKKKKIRQQEDRALNNILQKEVERLEEERLELKQKIRQLAKATGHKAVALGLTADDMAAVDQYIEELKEKKITEKVEDIRHETETDNIRIRNIQLDKDLDKQGKKIDNVLQENAEMKLKIEEVETENKQLEKGLREIDQHIRELNEHADGETQVVKCPTLEKMLTAIEAKNLVGRYDTSLYVKAQVDKLSGQNEELRHELKEARFEATRATVKLDRATTKVEQLETEVVHLREAGAGGYFQAISLPEGMTPTSSDVIASLNEHLVQTLQELSLKEGMIVKMEEAMEMYKCKFAVIRHQQGLCYEDYIRDKKEWESLQEKLKAEMDKIEGEREADKVRLQEFDHLLDTLSKDEVEVRRRLQDLTRKITVLRVNEKALTRRYTGLEDINAAQTKEVSKIRNDMIHMEAAVAERLGYLQRYKDMSVFKISALQKTLDNSVPVKDYDSLSRKYTELTEKYRDMLDRSNSLVVSKEASVGFETEIKRLESENSELKSELSVDKEKLHALEAAFENMRKQGMMSSSVLRDSEVLSISHKLTTLEMKELNERQRADHAVHMYDQQKAQLRAAEDRNYTLEQKFAELTKMNIEAQKVERELRDELSTCVTQAVSDADRRRIAALEKSEALLKNEVSTLKDIADVASHQVQTLDSQQVSRDKELTSLRQQLLDFQAQSDEKTVIGKLHRHIVQLQISEGTAVRRLQDSNNKVVKLEAQLLRTEQKLDEKNQTIYHNRLESRAKIRHLKQTIQDFRYKYSGSIPLQQQEQFSQSMVQLQEDKAKLEAELKRTNDERNEVEDQLAALKLRHVGVQELIATLKDGKGAQKVAEWHEKLEEIRLSELQTKRQIMRLKQQITFLEGVIKKHEQEVLALEEEKVRMTKSFEDRELSWEHREVELERIIVNMERQQAAIANAASQFESATGNIPDPSLSVATQLEQAISTIKANVKLILDAKAEAHASKTRMDELEKELRDKERELLLRDKIITDLRLRLPATADRDAIFKKVTGQTTGMIPEEDYEGKQAVTVAQNTVHSLQKRLAQKDEAIRKYEEMLHGAREETKALIRRHDEELQNMQRQLHNKHDTDFYKFKQAAIESVSKPHSQGPSNDQLRKLNQLEDIVAEQDNSIASLRTKLTQSRQDTKDWKYKYEDAIRHHNEEKDSMMGDHHDQMTALQSQIAELHKELKDKGVAMNLVEQELEAQKEANVRAPTTTMKALVERLKHQLQLKEKQHQALTKALSELRADMVSQAKADVQAHSEQAQQEYNVQKVVEKQTRHLQEQVDDLESQIQKLRRDLKKSKDHEHSMSEDLDEARHDINKKETYIRKIKEDKGRLEKEVEDVENKVRRMNTMASQRGLADNPQEIIELKRRNRSLQEELKKQKQNQPEKPYETNKGEEAVARWQESKKWQTMVEKMKVRLKDKDMELDRVHKAHELTKHALERANKDKENLERRLRQETRILPMKADQTDAKPAAPSVASHQLEELRKKNYALEEEVMRLKRQLSVGHDKAFEEIQLRNKFLTEKLEELESMAAQRNQNVEPLISSRTYKDLADKESALQKEVIRLSEENIELRFEVEQMRHDVPRLKSRVDDLQKYVEILKAEKEQLQIMSNSARSQSSSLSSTVSNLRRIGESGRTPKELEKTIALLKKVVEKTQLENEQLKKAPGVVSQEQMRLLRGENQGLKDQLEDLRSKMGATLSERYVSQQKGTAKVVADHDKLRKDLIKEMETNESLRIQVRQDELTIEQLRRDLQESRGGKPGGGSTTGGGTAGAPGHKDGSPAGGGKGWKSSVVTRMYEGKINSLEKDLEKKNKMLSDVKTLLREAADKESQLTAERDQLLKQVKILERLPAGADGQPPDLVQEYQIARLTIARLENEKSEIEHKLQITKDKRALPTGVDPQIEDLTAKLKSSHLEVQQLKMHNNKLQKELSNFGPEFFEEIEDLKYNYRDALEKNVEYEEQLRQVSKQFGLDLSLPDTPT